MVRLLRGHNRACLQHKTGKHTVYGAAWNKAHLCAATYTPYVQPAVRVKQQNQLMADKDDISIQLSGLSPVHCVLVFQSCEGDQGKTFSTILVIGCSPRIQKALPLRGF